MKIAVLLPFKENFSLNKAGAVSLFVNDINKKSLYKKDISVYGSTTSRNYLSKNYFNININNNFLKSANKQYVNNFLKSKHFKNIDILEIHNRPNYIKQIRAKYKNKLFLYFHNDPLKMNGSEHLNDRKYLINNVEKIFFNSNWCRERFFKNFENKVILQKKTSICYQSTNKVNIDFTKKERVISFVGKLNSAKGYDIFGESIIKILNKYKDWKAVIIGDEPREKLFYSHKNLKILGFKKNEFILNFLKKTSISVVCSFGRASLEAASRGSAVIISNRGGLPETSSAAIVLKELNSINLINEIDALIKDKSKLIDCQKNNYKNFYLTHEHVSKIIDNERSKVFINSFNIKKKKEFKIIHITNFNYRFNGRLHYNTGRRLNNGLIRLNHNVLTISDRDIINQNKKINDISGIKSLNKYILDCYINFKPDLVILGHADSVSSEVLDSFKKNNTYIAQWFLDPLTKYGPDYNNNKRRILEKINYIDSTFVTTDPNSLDFKLKNGFFLPNPCDYSFEILDNSKKNNENDLFFAMSHGVHRGNLKKGKTDNREIFVNKLIKKNPEINFDIYGMNGIQPIWADKFLDYVSKSNMGLNLSRGKPIKYYSSDRIAQLMGNGLLTFINKKTFLNDFFSNNHAVFYNDLDDLSYKILKYKKDNSQRKKIASNGKKFYFKYFNSTLVADYIVRKTLDQNLKDRFIW